MLNFGCVEKLYYISSPFSKCYKPFNFLTIKINAQLVSLLSNFDSKFDSVKLSAIEAMRLRTILGLVLVCCTLKIAMYTSNGLPSG